MGLSHGHRTSKVSRGWEVSNRSNHFSRSFWFPTSATICPTRNEKMEPGDVWRLRWKAGHSSRIADPGMDRRASDGKYRRQWNRCFRNECSCVCRRSRSIAKHRDRTSDGSSYGATRCWRRHVLIGCPEDCPSERRRTGGCIFVSRACAVLFDRRRITYVALTRLVPLS